MSAEHARELTPEEIIAGADSEIADADRLAADLERAVLDGDETVTYEQVEKARGLKRFAQLRKEAAQKKAEKLAADRAVAEFDAFLTEHLAGAQGRDEAVDKLLTKARGFLDQAIEAAREHDRHVYELAARAETTGNPYDRESDPELVGQGQLPEYSWFAARGVEMHFLGAGGVMTRLLKPYAKDLSPFGRYSKLRDALN